MPNDRQMLVHVGLHKTGTTWVQQQIFQAAANEHFRYSEDRTLLRGVWAQPNYGDFDPALARDTIMQGLQGSPDFLADMKKFTGHSWPMPFATAKDKQVNPAWTDLGQAYVRFANRFEDQDARFTKKRKRFSKNAIASKISGATPKGLHERMKKNSLLKIAQAIGDQYAASNSALSQRTGIDLERYGYIVTAARPQRAK